MKKQAVTFLIGFAIFSYCVCLFLSNNISFSKENEKFENTNSNNLFVQFNNDVHEKQYLSCMQYHYEDQSKLAIAFKFQFDTKELFESYQKKACISIEYSLIGSRCLFDENYTCQDIQEQYVKNNIFFPSLYNDNSEAYIEQTANIKSVMSEEGWKILGQGIYMQHTQLLNCNEEELTCISNQFHNSEITPGFQAYAILYSIRTNTDQIYNLKEDDFTLELQYTLDNTDYQAGILFYKLAFAIFILALFIRLNSQLRASKKQLPLHLEIYETIFVLFLYNDPFALPNYLLSSQLISYLQIITTVVSEFFILCFWINVFKIIFLEIKKTIGIFNKLIILAAIYTLLEFFLQISSYGKISSFELPNITIVCYIMAAIILLIFCGLQILFYQFYCNTSFSEKVATKDQLILLKYNYGIIAFHLTTLLYTLFTINDLLNISDGNSFRFARKNCLINISFVWFIYSYAPSMDSDGQTDDREAEGEQFLDEEAGEQVEKEYLADMQQRRQQMQNQQKDEVELQEVKVQNSDQVDRQDSVDIKEMDEFLNEKEDKFFI